jgi:hypothetical protein
MTKVVKFPRRPDPAQFPLTAAFPRDAEADEREAREIHEGLIARGILPGTELYDLSLENEVARRAWGIALPADAEQTADDVLGPGEGI